jgi:predicted exporter
VKQDEETALVALERTLAALEQAKRDGLVDGFTSAGAFVRSRATQEASFTRAKLARPRIEEIMRREGFLPEAFGPFFAALEPAAAGSFLTLEGLRATKLGAMLSPLAPRLPEGQAFVVPLRGARDGAAIAARLPDAIVIDEPALLERTYRDVRRNTIAMLALGFLLVGLTLFARYRSPRLVLAALVPAFLGGAGAVIVVGAAFGALNLLHLVAVLLVLSMGVDYGIFMVEGRRNRDERVSSLVSVATATSTTLLSFGLLALSTSPALRALGATITVGLTLTMILCPLALAFVKKEELG